MSYAFNHYIIDKTGLLKNIKKIQITVYSDSFLTHGLISEAVISGAKIFFEDNPVILSHVSRIKNKNRDNEFSHFKYQYIVSIYYHRGLKRDRSLKSLEKAIKNSFERLTDVDIELELSEPIVFGDNIRNHLKDLLEIISNSEHFNENLVLLKIEDRGGKFTVEHHEPGEVVLIEEQERDYVLDDSDPAIFLSFFDPNNTDYEDSFELELYDYATFRFQSLLGDLGITLDTKVRLLLKKNLGELVEEELRGSTNYDEETLFSAIRKVIKNFTKYFENELYFYNICPIRTCPKQIHGCEFSVLDRLSYEKRRNYYKLSEEKIGVEIEPASLALFPSQKNRSQENLEKWILDRCNYGENNEPNPLLIELLKKDKWVLTYKKTGKEKVPLFFSPEFVKITAKIGMETDKFKREKDQKRIQPTPEKRFHNIRRFVETLKNSMYILDEPLKISDIPKRAEKKWKKFKRPSFLTQNNKTKKINAFTETSPFFPSSPIKVLFLLSPKVSKKILKFFEVVLKNWDERFSSPLEHYFEFNFNEFVVAEKDDDYVSFLEEASRQHGKSEIAILGITEKISEEEGLYKNIYRTNLLQYHVPIPFITAKTILRRKPPINTLLGLLVKSGTQPWRLQDELNRPIIGVYYQAEKKQGKNNKELSPATLVTTRIERDGSFNGSVVYTLDKELDKEERHEKLSELIKTSLRVNIDSDVHLGGNQLPEVIKQEIMEISEDRIFIRIEKDPLLRIIDREKPHGYPDDGLAFIANMNKTILVTSSDIVSPRKMYSDDNSVRSPAVIKLIREKSKDSRNFMKNHEIIRDLFFLTRMNIKSVNGLSKHPVSIKFGYDAWKKIVFDLEIYEKELEFKKPLYL